MPAAVRVSLLGKKEEGEELSVLSVELAFSPFFVFFLSVKKMEQVPLQQVSLSE